MRNGFRRLSLLLSAFAAATSCSAWGQTRGSIFGIDYTTSGNIRTDITLNTDDGPNPYNQFGDPFNKVTVTRTPGNPGLPIDQFPPLEPFLGEGLPFSIPLVVLTDQIQRPQDTVENTLNYNVLRWEQQLELRFNKTMRFVGQLRALYNLYDYDDDFDARDYSNSQGMLEGGVPKLYHGKPNYFDFVVDGDNHPQELEFTGRDYFVDFPALMFEYSDGPISLRAGNQRIAWGQALFFRVMDKVDSLDLRRHLILDRALEEYSDERVPTLGLRLTAQLNSTTLMDAFVKQFKPTVLPNPNTPYNIIPTQFTVHDQFAEGGYDDELNYGIRLKGDYGAGGWQAIAVRRYNDFGVFRWTETGVDKDLPNTNPLGIVLNSYCAAVLGTGGGCGPLMAQTAFEVAPTPVSVVSADEWFWYAADVRLGGISALNAAVDEFPAAEQILARSVGDDFDRAHNELDAFFQASEGLRGHIARDYYRENVFGLGGSYVTEVEEPGSFFNQIIFNLEVAYTPERAFTPLSLSQTPIRSDETEIALVVEKYHRFTPSFPATYLVFQAMHKTDSDLFGRHLSGYGGKAVKGTNTEKAIATGVDGGATYLAVAFLQPWPAYIWELSAAALVDTRGGILVQPGLKWKPSGPITVEGFYNFIDGTTWNKNPNDSALSTLSFMNEFTVRLTYQF
jgi:hypothetical protein